MSNLNRTSTIVRTLQLDVCKFEDDIAMFPIDQAIIVIPIIQIDIMAYSFTLCGISSLIRSDRLVLDILDVSLVKSIELRRKRISLSD